MKQRRMLKSSVLSEQILECSLGLSGLSKDKLLHPQRHGADIRHLLQAKERIAQAVLHNENIVVIGDYDCDGVMSCVIMDALLKFLGCKRSKVRIPRRFSEGYGLSVKIVEEIVRDTDKGLIVTIDNGIAAIPAIRMAEEKGFDVVIIDHHQAYVENGQVILPPADIIVNPHVFSAPNVFVDYCGAGLAYKLAELFQIPTEMLERLSAFAALATIQDVVSVTGDNRNIIIAGIEAMGKGNISVGLKALLDELRLFRVNTQTMGFSIGPCINAAGRLLDDGAMYPYRLLSINEKSRISEAHERAQGLISLNAKRKMLCEEGAKIAEDYICENEIAGNNPLIIAASKETPIFEGVAGIVASRMEEKYKASCICLTPSHKDVSVLKGSGREYADVNIKKALDASASELLAYGGHAKACGLSLYQKNLLSFRKKMLEYYSQNTQAEKEDSEEEFCDVEIDASQIQDALHVLKRIGPFGTNNPPPRFLIRGIEVLPKNGKIYDSLGGTEETLKLYGNHLSMLGRYLYQSYVQSGAPVYINVIAEIDVNGYAKTEEPQLSLFAIEGIETVKKVSSLSDILRERMAVL